MAGGVVAIAIAVFLSGMVMGVIAVVAIAGRTVATHWRLRRPTGCPGTLVG